MTERAGSEARQASPAAGTIKGAEEERRSDYSTPSSSYKHGVCGEFEMGVCHSDSKCEIATIKSDRKYYSALSSKPGHCKIFFRYILKNKY